MRSVGESEHVCYRLNRVYKSWLAKRAGLAVAAAISGFVFFAFAPHSLFAAEKPVTFRGQTIYVDGTKYQNFNDWKGVTLLIQGILEGRRVLTL